MSVQYSISGSPQRSQVQHSGPAGCAQGCRWQMAEGGGTIYCQYCGAHRSVASNEIAHMATEKPVGNGWFRCPDCRGVFDNLQLHQLICPEAFVGCGYCGTGVKRSQLAAHQAGECAVATAEQKARARQGDVCAIQPEGPKQVIGFTQEVNDIQPPRQAGFNGPMEDPSQWQSIVPPRVSVGPQPGRQGLHGGPMGGMHVMEGAPPEWMQAAMTQAPVHGWVPASGHAGWNTAAMGGAIPPPAQFP